MFHKTMLALAVLLLPAGAVLAQSAKDSTKKPAMMPKDADPDWEVLAVRASAPSNDGDRVHLHGRHLTFERETLEAMLTIGFNMQKRQFAGEPEWAGREQWDIDGLANVEGEPSLPQLQSMVRKLLAERFGLIVHHETREMPVFALRVGKGGAKMTPNLTDPNGWMDQDGGSGNGWRLERLKNTSMGELGMILNFHVDRPVVDQTGLKGRYDFQLKWLTDDSHAGDPGAPPGLFTAMQEQLGLKLEPVRAPADVLVIDKVERPGAN